MADKKPVFKKLMRQSGKVYAWIRQYPLITLNSILLLAVIGLGVWYYSSTKGTLPQIAQVSHQAGSVNLKLEPATVTVAVNTETTINMTINTTTAKVSAAAVELAYNPAKLQVTSVTAGDFLTIVLVQSTIANGKINFTLAAPPDSGGKQGSGTLATIKVKPLTTGSSTLTFTGNTQVAVIGSNTNELKSAADATISTPGASPSPSPTPSLSPSPSPSPSLSPSPSPSPAPSASPNPTPSPSPSASPAASPSPSASVSPAPLIPPPQSLNSTALQSSPRPASPLIKSGPSPSASIRPEAATDMPETAPVRLKWWQIIINFFKELIKANT